MNQQLKTITGSALAGAGILTVVLLGARGCGNEDTAGMNYSDIYTVTGPAVSYKIGDDLGYVMQIPIRDYRGREGNIRIEGGARDYQKLHDIESGNKLMRSRDAHRDKKTGAYPGGSFYRLNESR